MQRKPTMHDVARAAGVGTMTVSRVLNQSPHVAAETAERVHRAVSKLGYHPNEMARALRSFKSRTIGVIVPNLDDTFYSTCAHAINLVAREHGYSVLITTSDDNADTEYEQAQQMMQRHVEGLAVIPTGNGRSRLGAPAFRSIPIVALDRPVKDAKIDSLVVENEGGAHAAVEHLIDAHQHRRILFLGYKRDLYTVQLRAAGYARAMKGAGLAPQRNFHCSSNEAALSVLRDALAGPEPPTAIFCANNLVTLHALWAVRKLRIQVPSRLAVVSFDDIDLGDTLDPALTVVRQPVAELGRAAALLLFERMGERNGVRNGVPSGDPKIKARPRPSQEVHAVLGLEVILRRSCGCPHDHAREATPIAVPAAPQAPKKQKKNGKRVAPS
ncbi:MAG TPA: LacI family DNA-binding transcriptional regulator, partial [Acidobacteriaceae bacterium]